MKAQCGAMKQKLRSTLTEQHFKNSVISHHCKKKSAEEIGAHTQTHSSKVHDVICEQPIGEEDKLTNKQKTAFLSRSMPPQSPCHATAAARKQMTKVAQLSQIFSAGE